MCSRGIPSVGILPSSTILAPCSCVSGIGINSDPPCDPFAPYSRPSCGASLCVGWPPIARANNKICVIVSTKCIGRLDRRDGRLRGGSYALASACRLVCWSWPLIFMPVWSPSLLTAFVPPTPVPTYGSSVAGIVLLLEGLFLLRCNLWQDPLPASSPPNDVLYTNVKALAHIYIVNLSAKKPLIIPMQCFCLALTAVTNCGSRSPHPVAGALCT